MNVAIGNDGPSCRNAKICGSRRGRLAHCGILSGLCVQAIGVFNIGLGDIQRLAVVHLGRYGVRRAGNYVRHAASSARWA